MKSTVLKILEQSMEKKAIQFSKKLNGVSKSLNNSMLGLTKAFKYATSDTQQMEVEDIALRLNNLIDDIEDLSKSVQFHNTNYNENRAY